MPAIPVSAIVVTKNEAAALPRCLAALAPFAEVLVVDSGSTDATREIATAHEARVVAYTWDGLYPKKRGWCLAHLPLAHDWVFFVDADEEVTPDLTAAVAEADFAGHAGFFVRGRYVWGGRVLRHGLLNAKLALFDRRCVGFPVVDDLGLPGMGEIEGHYQPVVLPHAPRTRIGTLRPALLHHACADRAAWDARHARYAAWERGMNARRAWPRDPRPWREALKRVFRAAPCRDLLAFVHSYVWKLGALDGRAGLDFALARRQYYRMIAQEGQT
ncbi:MAG TPA: glycosyltransferase family 2 protein [Rhodospirillaceae bacterium]|jgi:glycosyltransferase involved in cell wall biosynthesis|nr:glycosyltransferase family 2 protein [Alphaproteobacteria bacterium]HBH26580.1 glycosyltransferase family 2 protein [Rhodospirillaceae bacterium]